jgi:hypothetical protein
MAVIQFNGLITTMTVVSGVYTVTSVEVDGPVATVNAVAPGGIRVSLTLCDTADGVDVGFFRRTKDLSVYDKGLFTQPKRGSITDQVRYALAGL